MDPEYAYHARDRTRATGVLVLLSALVLVIGACGSSPVAAGSLGHAGPAGSSPHLSPDAAGPADTAGGSGSVGPTDSPGPAGSSDGGTNPGSGASPAQPSTGPVTAVAGGRFPGGLLIADRGNGRLIVVSSTGRIVWRFPARGSLPAGQRFAADDAFIDPDGKTIVANDEGHQVVDRIDIATRKIVWQYGHYNSPGRGSGHLHNPDDAYPLPNGNIVVADIKNCRILEIAPSKRIVHQWGRTGICVDNAPHTYGAPNGDTPLPDGGLLITEIHGSRVVRLSATGKVVFDIRVPVRYPSDAQLDANGNVVVCDYSTVGAVVAVSSKGKLVWRYGPSSGRGRLNHPSLAIPLADGTVSINDDFRHRMIVIDPKTKKIVWQYGRTDVPGRGAGELSIPDGHQPMPVGIFL